MWQRVTAITDRLYTLHGHPPTALRVRRTIRVINRRNTYLVLSHLLSRPFFFRSVPIAAKRHHQLRHVRPSVRISAAPIGRISVKFNTRDSHKNSVEKNQIWLISGEKKISHTLHEDLSVFRRVGNDVRSARIEQALLRFDSITSHADVPQCHVISNVLACYNKVPVIWVIRVIAVRLVSHCGLNTRLGVLCRRWSSRECLQYNVRYSHAISHRA